MDLRRSILLLLAPAWLFGAPAAAAQTRDTTSQQQPTGQVPVLTRPAPQQPPAEKPPADTPSTQQPAPSRPAVRLPNVRIPGIRLPSVESRTVSVPSLSGRSEAEARRILTGAGLALGEVSELPVDRPAGTVFLQSPAAGTQAQRGSAVAVTLARAPAPAPVRTATVPDVTGDPLATAVRRIQAAGLRVGSVEGASGSTARVSRQSHAGGQAVPPGTAVGLSMTAPAPPPVVATRPPVRPPRQQTPTQSQTQPTQPPVAPEKPPVARVDSIPVPDVGTRTLTDARAALAGAGLTASVDPALVDSASWTVVSQVPAVGARVPAGADVALSLAAPPAAVAVTEPAAVPPPVTGTVQPPPVTPGPSAPAQPETVPSSVSRWPWIALIVLILLAAAAAVGMRRVRARTPAAAVPVAVSARVRTGARTEVAVRGAPFAAAAPRLRMRTRRGAPVLSVAAAGPLFTPKGEAGD